MADSLLRLRQINKPELSGYISQVVLPTLRESGLDFSSTYLSSTGSGIFDLGEESNPYKNVYANNFHVPSGSGINFGNDLFFTAYYSGDNAVLAVGNYFITTSPEGISIIGPSGERGPSGAQGPTGVSGIGVTGIEKSGDYMNIYLSNSTFNSIQLVSGATGASGVSLTGFSQINSYIYPLFSNNTSGSGIQLVSGVQGERGEAGGILIDCNQFTGLWSGDRYPSVTIYNVDETIENPTLNFIKGMRYTIGVSGLNLSQINSTGTNYFADELGGTGYLRFCFWDTITPADHCNKTGRLINPECPDIDTTYLEGYLADGDIMYNPEENISKTAISFNVKWSAATGYKYGFVRCYQGGELNTEAAGGYVLGTAAVSLFGPQGPSGAQGPQGIVGPQGPAGSNGQSAPGVSISSVEQNSSLQIRFHYTDNTVSDWLTVPAGGPAGAQGLTGPVGPSGEVGPQGPIGPTGDRYAASFYVSNMLTTSGTTTYNGFQKQANGVDDWILATGALKTCYTGDRIWFRNQSLVGLGYSAWQKVLFSSTDYSNPNNFYATVAYFNKNNGEIQAIVESTPEFPTSNPINFDNYYGGAVSLNLGGLGSPGVTGAQGPSGATGPTGPEGSTRFSVSPLTQIVDSVPTNLDFSTNDCWDLSVSGLNNTITFNMNTFETGQTVMLRIRNTGEYDSNSPGTFFTWPESVIFPSDIPAPLPMVNASLTKCYACAYTFVRFRDIGANPNVMCTYSVNYELPR